MRAFVETSPILLIYSSIISTRLPPLQSYHLQCKSDLGKRLDPEIMTLVLSKSSRNVLILENACKVLYRWYYTPARLACFIWVRVYALLRTLLHTDLKRAPCKTVFCKLITKLLRSEPQLALHLFTATKLTIAKAWKTPVIRFEAVKNSQPSRLDNTLLSI